jgi:hypothetical protein
MIVHQLSLWQKELRQQRWSLLLAALFLALLGVVAWHAYETSGTATSRMSVISETLSVFVPLFALTQAHFSVVREYRQQTQLFVEALPLRRWEFPLAKLSWGLLTQGVLAGGLCLWVTQLADDTSARFLAITCTRTLAFVAVCWSVAFALAMLGRLRWLAAVTLCVGCYLLSKRGVELGRFGPFALLDTLSFPFERESFPVRALLESGAVTAGALLLGLGLPLLHEGSVTERLARPASAGEKTGFWAVLLAQGALVHLLPREQRPEPFSFTGAGILASEQRNVQVRCEDAALEPKARAVLAVLEGLSSRFTTELHVAEPPALRVTHNDSGGIRVVPGQPGERVLLEINLQRVTPALVAFVAAGQSFNQLSAGRAYFEPNRWFSNGFARYWAPANDSAAIDQYWLDALLVRRKVPLDEQLLSQWERLAELAGDDVSTSIALTLVEVLEQRFGREQLLQLARALLVRPTIRNGFDWLVAERADLPAALERATGESWAAFIAAYQLQLDAAALRLAQPLAALPTFSATLSIEHTEVGNNLVAELSGLAPDTTRECLFRHALLPPYDLAVPSDTLQASSLPWPAGVASITGRVRGRYQSGQRAFAAIDCPLPGLERYLRLDARRLEIP